MEKYSPNLRLILLANSTSNIIAPIRSRCLLVRVAAPTETEIARVLAIVGKKEGYTSCEPLEQRIAKDSARNLRRALLMFEAVHAQKCVVNLMWNMMILANPATATAFLRRRQSHRRIGRP